MDYIEQLQTRLQRIKDGRFALSQVSGTNMTTLYQVDKAIRTVEGQIREEVAKNQRFLRAMELAAQS